MASDLALLWDANLEYDLAGYKIYYLTATPDGWVDGTELPQGASPITIHLDTLETIVSPSFKLENLAEGESYQFAVTAFNKSGHESDFSDLVRYDAPASTYVSYPFTVSTNGQSTISPAEPVDVPEGATETFPITATISGDGDIIPGGATSIGFNSSQTFAFRPDANYHVADVIVDGKSVGPVASYTFDNVRGPHSIHIVFKGDTFPINLSVTGNGTISPDGVHEVAFGSDLLCTVSPETGYDIADVKVDGVSVGTVTEYMFSNITQAHDIEACFEKVVEGFFMEVGEVNVNHNWRQVSFSRPFVEPVVVASALSFNDDEPAVVRIDKVTTTGFEISVQEWDYLDDNHLDETIGYIAMEAGNFTLPDGTKVEAGICEASNTSGVNRLDFDGIFDQKPVVAASVVSFKNPNTVTMGLKKISATGFNYQIQEEESNQEFYNSYNSYYNDYINLYNFSYYSAYSGYAGVSFPSLPPPPLPQVTLPLPEYVSYIAWEPCRIKLHDVIIEVGRTKEIMNDSFKTIIFTKPSDMTPVFLAAMQTKNESDPASLRWDELNGTDVQVKVEEEKSFDQEISHASEVVGYFAIVSDKPVSTE